MRDYLMVGGLAALLLTACGQTSTQAPAADTSEPGMPASSATAWPAGFNVMGDGYPKTGDPCRRLGESALTVNYLDDSAILIGCPGAAGDAPAAGVVASGGKVVGAAEGITMITIPQGDANAGMAAAIGSQAMADNVLPAEPAKQ